MGATNDAETYSGDYSKFIFVGVVVALLVVAGAGELSARPPAVQTRDPFAGFVPGDSQRVALIDPTFTAAAYHQGGFYDFYVNPNNVSRLSVNVSNFLSRFPLEAWGDAVYLYKFMAGKNYNGTPPSFLTDAQVDAGALFSNGVRQYRALVIGHEEYVTANEYFQFQAFVASGGLIVNMDANNFWAQVDYSQTSGVETLVIGHGWSFDGTTAVPSSVHPFEARNINWTGGSYCCRDQVLSATPDAKNPIGKKLLTLYGGDVFDNSGSQEMNSLRNLTTTSLIANWTIIGVYAYAHGYRAGAFVSFGILGSNIILSDRATQRFLVLALQGDGLGVPGFD